MNSNTDTPRTDEEARMTPRDGVRVVEEYFACTLERELNAANARIAELESAIRNLRDVKGRYNSGYDRLVALITQPATQP